MSADTKTKYPSYYVTRHYTDFLNTGTQIFHSLSSDPEILSICGINKEGKNVIQIINLKKQPVNIEISGISGKLSKSVTTTEKNNWKENEIQLKISGDKMVAEIQAESLNTLVF
jgi:flagellar capping protein FliD